MKFKTSRFGEIEVPADLQMHFDDGVIGFADCRKFVILKHKPESMFFWLQSLDIPELAFTMLFPFEWVPGYAPGINKDDLSMIGANSSEGMEIYAMVAIPKDINAMTINLLSPVIVNPVTKKGRQIILHDSGYSVKHPLIPVAPSGQKKAPEATKSSSIC